MNTNKVFVANVYSIAQKEGETCNFHCEFIRETLIYEVCDDRFYDLLAERFIPSKFSSNLNIGDEIIIGGKTKQFKSTFNEFVENNRRNLSESKIKRLYLKKIRK